MARLAEGMGGGGGVINCSMVGAGGGEGNAGGVGGGGGDRRREGLPIRS